MNFNSIANNSSKFFNIEYFDGVIVKSIYNTKVSTIQDNAISFYDQSSFFVLTQDTPIINIELTA